MTDSPGKTFRIVVGVLAMMVVCVMLTICVILMATRPPSEEVLAATLTAMPTPTPVPTLTPTPIPTLPPVGEELLVCQREAGRAMRDRGMVGAVNVAGDHQFSLLWVSRKPVRGLEDAMGGVVMGFDVALDVWDQGCALYDRVQIEVYDREAGEQRHRLTVRVSMDDLLAWRAGRLNDKELLARLVVTVPGEP